MYIYIYSQLLDNRGGHPDNQSPLPARKVGPPWITSTPPTDNQPPPGKPSPPQNH